MPDLSVIIPVVQQDRHIGRCIERIEGIFRNEGIQGRILVTSRPDRAITNAVLTGTKAGCRSPDIMGGSAEHLITVYDAAMQAEAPVLLFLSNPDSARVEKIPELYRLARDEYDIVIGRSYLKRDRISGSTLPGRVHAGATVLLARLLFPHISDPLSGFFAVRNNVIGSITNKAGKSAILLEILGKTRYENISEISVPPPRETSGCSGPHLTEVLFQVASIGWYSFRHHESPAWKEEEKILRFIIVGLSGILVNMAVLYLLTSIIGIFYLLSSVVAIELSILNNFFWNDRWTFSKDAGHRLPDPWHRLGVYHLVSAGGILINIGILFILTDFFGVYYLVSNLIGILAAFAWNFLLNRNITWKPVFGGER